MAVYARRTCLISRSHTKKHRPPRPPETTFGVGGWVFRKWEGGFGFDPPPLMLLCQRVVGFRGGYQRWVPEGWKCF